MTHEDPLPQDPAALQREVLRLARRVLRLEQTLAQVESIRDTNATLLRQVMGELDLERARSRELLLNVLPEQIADRLATGETEIADGHDRLAVLFSDFVGFTRIAGDLEPRDLVARLNRLFSQFDRAAQHHGVEKIKTIGDAYLAVAGLQGGELDPVAAVARLALDILAIVDEAGPPWAVRVGLHAGPAVAGVIGTHKFAYDVWGDTVNVASRLESTSAAGRIHVSAQIVAALGDRFQVESRGLVELKGKGRQPTFFLLGPAPGAARDPGSTLSR